MNTMFSQLSSMSFHWVWSKFSCHRTAPDTGYTSTCINSFFTESRSQRLFEVRRKLQMWSGPTSLLKQGCLALVVQDCVIQVQFNACWTFIFKIIQVKCLSALYKLAHYKTKNNQTKGFFILCAFPLHYHYWSSGRWASDCHIQLCYWALSNS